MANRRELSGTDFTISSDFTGANGSTGRTYTLAYSNIVENTLLILVDNAPLQPGDTSAGFTYSSGVVTFKGNVWNDSKIAIYYDDATTGTFTSTYYCDPDDVKKILRFPSSFSGSTNPTETEVYELIEESMTEIDRLTRHAWREITVNKEYHDVPENFTYEYGVGLRLKLGHRKIRSLDSSEGDKIEVWTGSEWEDYLVTKTEGRGNDFWLDAEGGILFILQRYWFHRKRCVRVTYRYGDDSIPTDIRKACSYLVAADILDSDDYSALANETATGGNTNHADRIERWERKAAEILDRYKEFFTF